MAAAPPRARERKRAAAAEMSDEDEGDDAELELECDLRVEQVTLPASLDVRRPRAFPRGATCACSAHAQQCGHPLVRST